MSRLSNLAAITFLIALPLVPSCSRKDADGSSSQETITEYRKNARDQRAFGKYNDMYGITMTIGKRDGLNQMEIFLGAIDATDWSGASPYVIDAVNEVKSIKSGELPEIRRQKMTKFMVAYEMY